jgi:hypothetical protein
MAAVAPRQCRNEAIPQRSDAAAEQQLAHQRTSGTRSGLPTVPSQGINGSGGGRATGLGEDMK